LPWCVAFLAAVLHAFGQSAPPLDYYDGAIGQTGAALKSALHEITKGHTVLPYTSTNPDTRDALTDIGEAPGDPASVVLIYSGLTNLKTNNYQGGVGAGTWDREHRSRMDLWRLALTVARKAISSICVPRIPRCFARDNSRRSTTSKIVLA